MFWAILGMVLAVFLWFLAISTLTRTGFGYHTVGLQVTGVERVPFVTYWLFWLLSVCFGPFFTWFWLFPDGFRPDLYRILAGFNMFSAFSTLNRTGFGYRTVGLGDTSNEEFLEIFLRGSSVEVVLQSQRNYLCFPRATNAGEGKLCLLFLREIPVEHVLQGHGNYLGF